MMSQKPTDVVSDLVELTVNLLALEQSGPVK